jgi:hypothetical protein
MLGPGASRRRVAGVLSTVYADGAAGGDGGRPLKGGPASP